MQVNYELLTKAIDPQDVLGSMFSCELISFEEKEKISSIQDERGKRRACEKMVDMLLKSWKRGLMDRDKLMARTDFFILAYILFMLLCILSINGNSLLTLSINSILASTIFVSVCVSVYIFPLVILGII